MADIEYMTTHELYAWVADPEFQQLAATFDQLLANNAGFDQLGPAAQAAYTRLVDYLGELQQQRDDTHQLLTALEQVGHANDVPFDETHLRLSDDLSTMFADARFADEDSAYAELCRQTESEYEQLCQFLEAFGQYYAHVGIISTMASNPETAFDMIR